MKWISFFLLSSFLFLNSAFSVYKPRVIYGEDNRMDLFQVQDPGLRSIASSTAAMMNKSALKKVGTVYQLISGTFGQEFRLCTSEPYFNQPSAAMCSGFLVGQDLLATAGHCISSSDCSTMAFAFGYAMRSSTEAPQSIPEEDVYFCKAVIAREYTPRQDYSLVQLDRPVRSRLPLKLADRGVRAQDPLVVIGHPSGLPTKVAGGAIVRSQREGYFVANLDTYGGNSGSAVFDANTLEVTGILVRGEQDFRYDSSNKCYRSNQCSNLGCRGEDVTNISFIAKALSTTYLD